MRGINSNPPNTTPNKEKIMAENEPTQDIDPKDFKETLEYQALESGPTPPAEQVVEPQQAEPEAPQREILSGLQSRGFDVSSYSSDDEFISDTETKYASNIQDEQRRMHEDVQQKREFLEAKAPAAQPIPQERVAPRQGAQPEFDPSWADLVEDDGSGRYVVRPEYIGSVSPEIAERVNNYVAFRQDRSNSLINDPVRTVLEAGLGHQIQNQINSTVKKALSSTNMRNQAADFVKENEAVLYLHDESTGQPKTDRSGNPMLSPVGMALNQAHVTLRQKGMYDPVSRHQVAMQMVQNHFTQQQLAMPQQQQPENSDFKEQYTDQPFAEPTNPLPPGYMPNTPVQPNANSLGSGGLPEHNSLGSLATALAVHKGFLQPK
jgi:hypothetical protein